MKPFSLARRLIAVILALEALSALALIGVATVHEHQIQLATFNASLVAASESLMGAVQDAEDKDDNVLLDLRTVRVAKEAVYRVTDEHGRLLGSAGDSEQAFQALSAESGFHRQMVDGKSYGFYTLHGLRIIDPGEKGGGTSHNITLIYGMPARRVWHKVFEQARFIAIATVVLLSTTALLMAIVIRRHLAPVQALAVEAGRIHTGNWLFHAPESAKRLLELEPLSNALEAALERVQQSFEQQRRFTNDAAHELKTDVAIVKSSLQLLAMRRRSVDEYTDGLVQSLNDMTRLEDTVQRMLTLARLEETPSSQKIDEILPACSLREAAEEAVHLNSSFSQIKRIDVQLEATDEARVPLHRNDAVLLCTNLLMNALQHSPENGTVLLTLAHAQDNGVFFTVRDWGDGIPKEDLPHLFRPFYRSDASRSRKSGGTGLGLSICKAICDRANGKVSIINHTGGGTLVTVSLPSQNS